MAYTVTVHVALPGTPLKNGPKPTSQAGHVWYEITDTATNTSRSYGFQSINGTASGPGEVVDNDTDNYQNPYYSRTIEITEAQYKSLQQYGENGYQKRWNHFHNQYGGLANSCVDFTWGGLNQAGLHANGYTTFLGIKVSDTKELLDFEGKIRPKANIDFIQSIQAPFPASKLNQEQHNPRPKQDWMQRQLTENEQKPQPTWDAQQPQMANATRFHDRPDLAGLSEKIGAAFPNLNSEQNERLTAYWAYRCARECMPVESIGRMVAEHRSDGRNLLHAFNQAETQAVTANLEKALNTPVEQSLNALQQADLQQQALAQQQAHSAPVMKV